MRKTLVPLAAIAAATCTGFSEDAQGNKSDYNLFNRTPTPALRQMESTLDMVDSSQTVDPGHFQFDARLVSAYLYSETISPQPGVSYERSIDLYVWEPVFSLGVLKNVDLEVSPTYHHVSETYNTTWYGYNVSKYSRSDSDFGDVFAAAKINLWGNDGGTTSLALVPELIIPTGNYDLMGGLEIPFSVRLSKEFLVKLSTAATTFQTYPDKIEARFINSASLQYRLSDELISFWTLETITTTRKNDQWFGYTGPGLGIQFTPNFQAYAAVRFGLEKYSYDYNPYFGVCVRF